MNEFSLDTIDDIISDTIKLEREIDIRGIDKQYVNNSATKKLAYLQVAKELLEEGHKVANHQQGIIVNNKFIIGASLNKWRVDGKAKWYWYGKKSFAKALEPRS
jgi:hypothetical protein